MENAGFSAPQAFHRGNDRHIFFNRGVLSVRGTRVDDFIRVFNVGDSIVRAFIGSDAGSEQKDFNKGDVKFMFLRGYSGDDEIRNETAIRSSILADSGNDLVFGGSNRDRILAGSGDDTVNAGAGHDLILGSSGNDTVNAGDGNDRVYGHTGNDILNGDAGRDRIFGSIGADTINGGADNDYVNGGAHNDRIGGGGGHDYLVGSTGNDTIGGGDGNDRIFGSSGNDNLSGDAGNDLLVGSKGNDNLRGGAGLDSLFGGLGDDTSNGGEGADRFLMVDDDPISDFSAEDAKVLFRASGPVTVNLRGGRYTYSGGRFTDLDIIRIDGALSTLVRRTGSNVLIKQSNGDSISFTRHGRLLNRRSGFSSWSGGNGEVHLANSAFTSFSFLSQNVYHQIGDNWDSTTENSDIDSFRAISNWRQSGGRWTYDRDSRFVRRQGTFDPFEDFETSFAAYFMALARQRYRGTPAGRYGIGAQAAPKKMDWLSDWIDNL